MKKITFLVIFCLFSISSFAQDKNRPRCGTVNVDSTMLKKMPWYGNNQFLLDYVDSIENIPADNSSQNRSYVPIGATPIQTIHIPVKAWVYTDDLGNGNINNHQVQQYIDGCNREFKNNGVLIQFYLKCKTTFIKNSHLNTNSDADDQFFMRVKYRDDHALNVHFVRDFPTVEELGYTYLPYGNIPEYQK